MQKPATNNHPIHDLFKKRWSPRAFSEKPVETEKLHSIFEAARWAPSSMNEQPWRFILGIKGDKTWDLIYESLGEWNQKWAGKAPVLILNLAKKTFTYKGKPNPTHAFDTGLAVAMLVTEVVNQGLFGHQMSGFSAEKAATLLHIPDDYLPLSVTAVGYYGNADDLPADMLKSEFEERKRRLMDETVFTGIFGKVWK